MKLNECYKGACIGPFGHLMLEEEARALDKLLETEDGQSYEVLTKTTGNHPSNHFVAGENADVSVVTDDSVDEDCEIVDGKNIDWNAFRKNPVVTFGHNFYNPPIGKSLWQKQVGNSWRAKTQYIPRPESLAKENEWFPDTLFSMIKQGFLPGKSIGGIQKRRSPTAEEMQKHGAKLRSVIFEAKIYEYSVVTRQANSNAIVQAVSKGLFQTKDDRLLEEFPELKKTIENAREEVISIKSFRTLQEFQKESQSQLQHQVAALNNRIPELIEDALARQLGKV